MTLPRLRAKEFVGSVLEATLHNVLAIQSTYPWSLVVLWRPSSYALDVQLSFAHRVLLEALREAVPTRVGDETLQSLFANPARTH